MITSSYGNPESAPAKYAHRVFELVAENRTSVSVC